MLHFQSPSSSFSEKVLENKPPQSSPVGAPMERVAHFQSLLLHVSQIPHESSDKNALGKERSPMFPRMGPLWKQIHISRALVSIFFAVPTKGALPMKCMENIQSPSMEPHADGRHTYNGVQPGSPRGSLTTLLPLSQCHAAFSMMSSTLAWVDQSPISQHVLVTLNRVYPPHLLPPPM